jgi:hypothetical protein
MVLKIMHEIKLSPTSLENRHEDDHISDNDLQELFDSSARIRSMEELVGAYDDIFPGEEGVLPELLQDSSHSESSRSFSSDSRITTTPTTRLSSSRARHTVERRQSLNKQVKRAPRIISRTGKQKSEQAITKEISTGNNTPPAPVTAKPSKIMRSKSFLETPSRLIKQKIGMMRPKPILETPTARLIKKSVSHEKKMEAKSQEFAPISPLRGVRRNYTEQEIAPTSPTRGVRRNYSLCMTDVLSEYDQIVNELELD